MTHETAQQRRRRHKADPYRGQILAPKVDMPPVVCECSHLRLVHEPECPMPGCCCTEYREAE